MRDMISVASGFQYSVNIGYDLGSDDKLKNFIPTKSALSLLEDILLSVNPTSSDRARVLIGAYGKGKSHIVLTILSILMKRDLGLFEKLLPRIKDNPRLYQLVQNYYESDNKILPVVISGSNTSLTQAQLKKLAKIIKDTSVGCDRYVFALPKHYKDVDAVAQEFSAVAKLRDQAGDDPVLFDEYEVVFEDLQEIIKGFIGKYTHPESYRSTYIHNGTELQIRRKSGLTEIMSRICDAVYSLTPVINNESVNKNDITSIAQNSRNKIVSALLRGELEPNLGLSGTGQEVSIMRSTLLRTGIWMEDGGIPQINLRPENVAMRNMLETIENFILEARQNGKISFSVLYERLTSPEYHIGLRFGLIPIYIAAVLHNYRQQTVINDRFGPVPTSVDVLVQINSDPNSFTLEYLDWNPEKEEYISRLADAFSEYVVDAEKAGNSYDYVANAMRRWYMALPKFSKESTRRPSGEKLVRRQIEIMKLLRQNTSSSDLLFKRLPEAVDCHGDYADAATDVIDAKGIFDGLLAELKQDLIEKTKDAFLPENDKAAGKKITLTDAVKEWCERLDPKSFEQLFSDGTDRFLQHLRTMTNDEDLFISRLAIQPIKEELKQCLRTEEKMICSSRIS